MEKSLRDSTLKIVNPATGIKLKRIDKDDKKSIRKKYQSLLVGQKSWAKVDVKERIAAMKKFSDLLDIERVELAETLSAEMGKPYQESLNEIQGARGRIFFFLNNTEDWLKEEWMIKDGATREKLTFEPLGVVGNISAWNYPFLIGVNVFVPALLCGNAVLYKPSEYSSLTGLKIQELLFEAGFPENVFQAVIGGAEVGEELLNLPLNGYFFTGSYKTGRYIASKVAEKLVPCQLELGGKDPLYVMADVDVKQAAINAVEGSFYNNGQSCCAVERIYVNHKIYDEFVAEFVSELEINYTLGLPAAKGTRLGAISRKEQLSFLESQVKDAVEKGATIKCGGKIADRKGFFFEPTVLVDVNHEMRVMKEETFGPVIGIQKVQNNEEAISLMQDTEFGLTAAVFSGMEQAALNVLEKMDVGTAYWNCCDRVSPNLPWSGRRNSGMGATLSYIGIRAFVQPKAYHLRDL